MTIIKGVSYSIIIKIIEVILSFALIAILARLLNPIEFGLFAIILALQALFNPVIDMGLGSAYIKVKVPTEELINSFFTVNIILGLLNFTILILLAPIISYFYDEVLLNLILVFSISVILNSLSRQANSQLARDKRFDTLMIISIIANTSTFIVTLLVAFNDYGVWTFVIKAIFFNFITLILIHYYVKNQYKITTFKTLFNYRNEFKFGFQLFINRMTEGTVNSFDKFIFGKIFGMELLGQYSNAQQISKMTDTHIRMPITGAIYSYLERFSDNKKLSFYTDFARLVFLITSMFSGFIILEGDFLIVQFLGEKWRFASLYIQPLGLFAMGMVYKGIFTIITMSEDNMKYQNKLFFNYAILFFITVFIMYWIDTREYYYIIILSLEMFIYWFFFLNKEIIKISRSYKMNIDILFLFILIILLYLLKGFMEFSLIIECIFIFILFELSLIIYIHINFKYLINKRKVNNE